MASPYFCAGEEFERNALGEGAGFDLPVFFLLSGVISSGEHEVGGLRE